MAIFFIHLPPEFHPVLGLCASTLGAALLFTPGQALIGGLYPDMSLGLCQLGSSTQLDLVVEFVVVGF